jgi:hypothetical protein
LRTGKHDGDCYEIDNLKWMLSNYWLWYKRLWILEHLCKLLNTVIISW